MRKQTVITLLLFAHTLVLAFNNFPHTRLTYAVDDFYLWYMNLTGQYQRGWGMYSKPYETNDFYLFEIAQGDHRAEPSRFLKIENSRELYLVEGLMRGQASKTEALAKLFLSAKKKELGLGNTVRIKLHHYAESRSTNPADWRRIRTVKE